jgi:hypothetical protein
MARLIAVWRERAGTLFHVHIGRRGALLLILGGMNIWYGAALVAAEHAIAGVPPRWWPASTAAVVGLDVLVWGWVWIAVGLFLWTGVPRVASDRFQFAAVVALYACWSFSALLFFIQTDNPGAWGPAGIYGGIAFAVLMAAGWRDRRDIEAGRLSRYRQQQQP